MNEVELEELVREMRPYLLAFKAELLLEIKVDPRPGVKESARDMVGEIETLLERSRDVLGEGK